jgi:hypothetical protein
MTQSPTRLARRGLFDSQPDGGTVHCTACGGSTIQCRDATCSRRRPRSCTRRGDRTVRRRPLPAIRSAAGRRGRGADALVTLGTHRAAVCTALDGLDSVATQRCPTNMSDRARPVSFVPRCQGWCGSQKNTGIDSAVVITEWRAISLPRSQVNERRKCVGTPCVRSARGPPRQPCSRWAAQRPSRIGWHGRRGCDRRRPRSEHERLTQRALHLTDRITMPPHRPDQILLFNTNPTGPTPIPTSTSARRRLTMQEPVRINDDKPRFI